ncbi:hypothetical protein DFH09DRAFT_1117510 [Mycena vulgaris]|nr:hypothetical protein DFH09DRAFT_1117510 [Mycena vulgaris]
MTADISLPAEATSASNPQAALEALVARVAALSKMSLALAQECLEVHTSLPTIVDAAVAAAVAAAIPPVPTWVQGIARTPDEVDAAHPPGPGDDLVYHVVTIGREPGIYTSLRDSDYQVLGVPAGKRLKKSSRVEALAYYRLRYGENLVEKWVPATEIIVPTKPVAGPSNLASFVVPRAPYYAPGTAGARYQADLETTDREGF